MRWPPALTMPPWDWSDCHTPTPDHSCCSREAEAAELAVLKATGSADRRIDGWPTVLSGLASGPSLKQRTAATRGELRPFLLPLSGFPHGPQVGSL